MSLTLAEFRQLTAHLPGNATISLTAGDVGLIWLDTDAETLIEEVTIEGIQAGTERMEYLDDSDVMYQSDKLRFDPKPTCQDGSGDADVDGPTDLRPLIYLGRDLAQLESHPVLDCAKHAKLSREIEELREKHGPIATEQILLGYREFARQGWENNDRRPGESTYVEPPKPTDMPTGWDADNEFAVCLAALRRYRADRQRRLDDTPF